MNSVNYNSQPYGHSAALKVGVQPNCSEEVRSIFSELEKVIGRKVDFVEGTFENAATMLKERKIDISAHGISSTNSSAPSDISHPSEPYLSVKRGFNVIKNSEMHKSGNINGANVAVMRNSTAEQDLDAHYKTSNISRRYVKSLETARLLLDSLEIDAIAEGDIGFRFNPEDEKKYAMIDTHPLDPDKPESESLVFWVHNGHHSWLLSPLNDILAPHQGNIFRSRLQNSA